MRLLVEALALRRGSRMLAADLSFRVDGGEALLLKGPNGAGKTTLLRTLAGLIAPAAGRIRIERDNAPAAEVGEHCHLVGHANAVKPTLTAFENLAFWAEFLAPGRRSRAQTHGTVEAALARLGIDALADIPAAFFSAGQRRRLGLARLLVAPRSIWLLDEPSVSLDREATVTLAELIRGQLGVGGIVVAATHIELGLTDAHELVLGPVPAEAA